MSQKENSRLNDIRKRITDLAGDVDAALFVAVVENSACVAITAEDLSRIMAMLADQMIDKEHSDVFCTIFFGAVGLACMHSDRFFIEMDEVMEAVKKERVNRRHYGQNEN